MLCAVGSAHAGDGESWNFSLPAGSRPQQETPDTAVVDSMALVETVPETPEDYNRRGIARMEAGDREGAVADFNKAIELDPQLSGAFFQQAGVKGKPQIDNRIVLDDYNRLTGLDAGYVFAFDNRGLIKYIGGDYKGAIADFSAAIVIDPDNPLPYKHRGYARHDLKDYDGAIADYSKAIELDPKAGDTYRNRALAKKQSGDEAGALADLKEAAALGDRSARSMLRSEGITGET